MVASFRPTDPLYASQWHFSLIGRLGFGTSANTLGIERIWADYKGELIRVGVWDDGVQAGHWDLEPITKPRAMSPSAERSITASP